MKLFLNHELKIAATMKRDKNRYSMFTKPLPMLPLSAVGVF